MRKVGLMGGSFDPCHRGHINLAIDARIQAGLDEVILMPAKIQPFKMGKKVTDGKHRANMLKEAVKNIEGIRVSVWEMEQDSISYTYNTLNYIKEVEGPDTEVYFISGTDSFLTMEKWMNGIDMLKENSFIVGVRPGYKEDELNLAIENAKEKYGTKVIKIDNRRFHISSTEIRERIAKGEAFNDLVTEEVERYILEHGLYID